jgi:hypothetical protein
MAKARVRARIKKDSLTPGIHAFDDKLQEALLTLLDYWGVKGTSEMRTGARWTDRTTNARNSLDYRVNRRGGDFSITYYGGMHYNIWLEIRWSGKYAIIGPVMISVAPRLRSMLADILDQL